MGGIKEEFWIREKKGKNSEVENIDRIDLLNPFQVLHLISFLFYISVSNSNYIYNSQQHSPSRWGKDII